MTPSPKNGRARANGHSEAQARSRHPEAPAAAIKVIVADSQSIYRVGIRKIFALEDDIRVVAQAENLGQTIAAACKSQADVILFESHISPNPAEAISELLRKAPESRIVVVTAHADEADTVELLRRGARGILARSISPDLLVRCVRKVAAGELWLDNQGVNWVIEAYRAQAAQLTTPRPRTKLSSKELLIIGHVTQGLRNREIAKEIGTSEQVIKNYLRKVYDKLGVSDRLELALYCIHHRLLQNPEAAGLMPAAQAAAALEVKSAAPAGATSALSAAAGK